MNHNERMKTVDNQVSDAVAELLLWFERGGYFRCYDPQRRDREGTAYKKGYEVRFVLDSEKNLQEVRRLLTAAGIRPARPFRKHQRYVQPVYGRSALEQFVNYWETARLSSHPKFLALIERRTRRKEEGGVSNRELRRRLGIRPATQARGGASARLPKFRGRRPKAPKGSRR